MFMLTKGRRKQQEAKANEDASKVISAFFPMTRN
jgi:hypothetical protein